MDEDLRFMRFRRLVRKLNVNVLESCCGVREINYEYGILCCRAIDERFRGLIRVMSSDVEKNDE